MKGRALSHMKKIPILPKRKKAKKAAPTRITNDTVAEHRERVLAGGRRFKYPIQYAKHKLVINAVIIVTVTIIILIIFGWWQLYVVKSSNTFFYRASQILSLPVASVDGESARYSDYLLNYRTSEYYLTHYDNVDPNDKGGKAELEYKKRSALDVAIADAYARKLAREYDVSLASTEVDEALDVLRIASNGTLTEETSAESSQRILGISSGELETLVRNSLLRGKVSFAVDDRARTIQAKTYELLQGTKNLDEVYTQINKLYPNEVIKGSSGLVSTSNMLDGLRVSRIAELKVGQVSDVMQSAKGEGYYYVELTSKNDTQVSFNFLKIPLKQFSSNLEQLRSDGKIKEYIKIDTAN